MRRHSMALGGAFAVCVMGLASPAGAAGMTFFVTSTGVGNGADLGGLEGADAHCAALAQAAGAAGTWHAYLSTQAKDGEPAVDARDRIGATGSRCRR